MHSLGVLYGLLLPFPHVAPLSVVHTLLLPTPRYRPPLWLVSLQQVVEPARKRRAVGGGAAGARGGESGPRGGLWVRGRGGRALTTGAQLLVSVTTVGLVSRWRAPAVALAGDQPAGTTASWGRAAAAAASSRSMTAGAARASGRHGAAMLTGKRGCAPLLTALPVADGGGTDGCGAGAPQLARSQVASGAQLRVGGEGGGVPPSPARLA